MNAETTQVVFLNLPSPPQRNVLREFAGGFGVALPSSRQYSGHDGATQPYLALVYGATLSAQAGLSAEYLDAQAEGLDLDALEQRLVLTMPKVIVAPLGLPSLQFDLDALARLKAATGADVVSLGTVCRPVPLLTEVLGHGAVDVAVTGDLEPVIVDLLTALLSGGSLAEVRGTATVDDDGTLKRNEGVDVSDLDTLPIPAFNMLPMARYATWEFGLDHRLLGRQYGSWPRYFPLYMSRGCPHNCEYCPYPLGWGTRWRRKSVDRFVEEIAATVEAGTSHILLRDQTISESVPYLESACEGIVAAGLRVQWLCEARPGSLGPSTLRLMQRAGCRRIHYGVETGDPTVFTDQAKRGIDPTVIDRSLGDTKAAGIEPSLHFLVGFRYDSWRSIGATIDLIHRCKVGSGDCSIMTPYPGTRFYERMRAEGRILATSWSQFTGTDPILRLDGLSSAELEDARRAILRALQANRRRSLRSLVRGNRRSAGALSVPRAQPAMALTLPVQAGTPPYSDMDEL